MKITNEKTCKLVYYEEYSKSKEATKREDQLLKLQNSLLSELIIENNPSFIDLLNDD